MFHRVAAFCFTRRHSPSLKSAACSWLLPSRLVIVRIRRDCFVIEEIGFVLGLTHTLEGPGRLVQIEEAC